MTVGKAEVLDISGAVADIMVADPKIADVSVLQSNKIYIVGASLGIPMLSFWIAAGMLSLNLMLLFRLIPKRSRL